MKFKTLLFDIETAPNVCFVWQGMHEVNVIEIIEEGYMLSFAWKWLGQKQTKVLAVNDFKGSLEARKKKLVLALHELFDETDVLVGHNVKGFDAKNANKYFVLYNLLPPSPYKVVDTLTIARSNFKFNSNRLNDLGKFLKLGVKVETGGFKLWKECMEGSKKAFNKMKRYNKQDVDLLEKVYLRIRPYTKTHPNIAILNGYRCPMCDSKNVQSRGYRTLSGGFLRRRYRCNDCGRWSASQEKIRVKKDYLK